MNNKQRFICATHGLQLELRARLSLARQCQWGKIASLHYPNKSDAWAVARYGMRPLSRY